MRIAVELKSMGLSLTKSGPSLLWKSFFNQGKGPVFCHRDASSRQISVEITTMPPCCLLSVRTKLFGGEVWQMRKWSTHQDFALSQEGPFSATLSPTVGRPAE